MHFCCRRAIHTDNPTEAARKISLAIRQIRQEDINLLLTKTTAARSSQGQRSSSEMAAKFKAPC